MGKNQGNFTMFNPFSRGDTDVVDEEEPPAISRSTMEARLRKLGILKLVPKKKAVVSEQQDQEPASLNRDDSISPLYTKLQGKVSKSNIRTASTRQGLGF